MAGPRPAYYPPANTTAQNFAHTHPGSPLDSIGKILWHSTEGSSWPPYAGGSEAPHMTALPVIASKRITWRAHFPATMNSRGLVNEPGGVQTNLDDVFQIELVGTCDPGLHARAPGLIYMPEAPDWYLDELAAFAFWAHTNWGVPLVTLPFQNYPASAGARRPAGPSNTVRLSGTAWDAYRGHLGHQHAPENVHGDPGGINMPAVIVAAAKLGDEMAFDPIDVWKGTGVDAIPHNTVADPTKPTSATNPDWQPASILEEDNRNLRDVLDRVGAMQTQLTELTAAVAALARPVTPSDSGT